MLKNKFWFLSLLLIIYLCIVVESQDWPMLQHDAQHTGRTSISVVPGNTAKWVWVDESHITTNFVSQANVSINYPSTRTVILAGDVQPIVAENKVFFGATNGEFYALNGTNGATVWKKQLKRAILHTAAYASSTVVTGCMDGKIYAFNAGDGVQKWVYATGAGISVAPIIVNNVVYVGSRDGYFYAINLGDGSLKWRYKTIADNANHVHSGAPIMQSAAASTDGTKIFFGAENMYFYCLDASNGTEIWRKKLGGMSFQYSWPVVYNNIVMTFVTVPRGLSENVMESELDSLPAKGSSESVFDYAARIWPQERTVIRNWLAANPLYRNFYVMDINTGNSPYSEEVPMGRVGGIGYPGRAPVIDNQNRILMYWRVRSATFMDGTGTYGTKYPPDISAMDPATGDRIWLNIKASGWFQNELDNNYVLTVGGNYLYLNNHMRWSNCINLTNGNVKYITRALENWDGTSWRWTNCLIWIGNDGTNSMPPPSLHRSPQGDCGVVIASINGTPTLIIQESGHYQINFGCIAAIQ